jgi:Zn-finger in ubiquitin-hydrolases and other protein
MKKLCSHLETLTSVKESKDYVCEECIKMGSNWVHLRVCQTCGATLCCDDSPHRHMTAHFHAKGHPVISSAEPGERWLWCYVDRQTATY